MGNFYCVVKLFLIISISLKINYLWLNIKIPLLGTLLYIIA